jgi:carbonic anhydrase
VIFVCGDGPWTGIRGAIDEVQLGKLSGLLARVRAAVEATRYQGDRSATNCDFVNAMARKNVELTMANVRKGSAVVADLGASGGSRSSAVDCSRID